MMTMMAITKEKEYTVILQSIDFCFYRSQNSSFGAIHTVLYEREGILRGTKKGASQIKTIISG